MGIRVITTDDVPAAGCAAAAAGGGVADAAWLLPSRDAALVRRRTLALGVGGRPGAQAGFGVACSSMDDFVDDRWELFGAGTPCVSAMRRMLTMRAALRQERGRAAGARLADTKGVVELLAQAAEVGLGLPAFVEVMEGAGAAPLLFESEVELLGTVARYRGLLHRAGLCERSEALRALSEDESVPWPTMVVEGAVSLDAAWARFFAGVSERTDVVFLVEGDAGSGFDPASELCAQLRAAGAEPRRERRLRGARAGRAEELCALSAALYGATSGDAARVRACGAVRVVLPAGHCAETRAVAEEIVASGAGDVTVACADPDAMAQALAELLVPRGATVRAGFSRPFGQTDFGRALLCGLELARGGGADAFAASDLALSALLGLGTDEAWGLGAKWRSNRLVRAEDMLDDLDAAAAETPRAFLARLRAGDVAGACDQAEALYGAHPGLLPAERAENLAAVSAARDFAQACEAVGLSCVDEMDLLVDRAVPCGRAWAPARDGGVCVDVVSHAAAAGLSRGGVQLMVVCDLDAKTQPVRADRGPLDALLEKIGCAPARDALARRRGDFAALVRAAREGLVLERVLFDEDAAPVNPAVVLEDACDCYRAGRGDADEATGLPRALGPHVRQRGEELLRQNLGGGVADAPRERLSLGAPDCATAAARRMVLLPRTGPEGLRGLPVLSPSALETYLDCPYQWFATRRLHASGIDAGFGPAERGSFVHGVLRRYHERWGREHGAGGARKARGERLVEASALLDEAFDEELAAQRGLEPAANPYIALTQADERQVDDVRRALHDFLLYDAGLLPGFEPRLFELSFGNEERVDYAGLPVRGIIDRVDFDEKGRAVVIDYKSSLGDDYCLARKGDEGFVLPHRVQTLVYASVLRRMQGVRVVGALYVNVLGGASQQRVCGAFDDKVIGAADLPGINARRNAATGAGFGSFDDLLDEVEAMVAERLEPLVQGEVARRPRREDACTFCPAPNCEKRCGR